MLATLPIPSNALCGMTYRDLCRLFVIMLNSDHNNPEGNHRFYTVTQTIMKRTGATGIMVDEFFQMEKVLFVH